jgi:hypothetical protein
MGKFKRHPSAPGGLNLLRSTYPAKPLDLSVGLAYLAKPDPSTEKIWELFRYVRAEVQHEYSLLMGRVTWYITCQSFLLTIYTISYANRPGPNWFSNAALPSLAIAISLLAYFMIQGATQTINMWGDLRREIIKKSCAADPDKGLNPIIIARWRSDCPRDPIHSRALWFPQLITIVFALTWLVIAIGSALNPWMPAKP